MAGSDEGRTYSQLSVVVEWLCEGVCMKLICSIVLVFCFSMLAERVTLGVMVALLIAFAVLLGLPIHTEAFRPDQ